ncbi:bacteriophage Gp15 family protein [Eubacterium maltosivorans]|uniref:Bacteriophage Gp15 protein n=1 Tax=Eubacterium maltosivorans TaxID=2041044 RepID=A0A4P9C612_EUBML|nr:bacteriophage Gp15 family protein [Eubacterium maltosivorans]QCT70827.1 hypothetical protein CPZ25_005620 [Eubacterium maltosivorans]
MIFTQRLPKTVEVDGHHYPIDPDYRVMAAFEVNMQEKRGDERAVIAATLLLFYPEGIPANIEMAAQKMLWFYQCGKEEKSREAESSRHPKQVYSFKADEGYIFSAFLDQYGINLLEVEFMHWWVFRRLFNGLKADNEIVKIMGYRSVKIDSKMPPEKRHLYRKLQKQYQLPDYRTEEQREKDMVTALSSFF